ncbi:hypothetical protein C8A01DRAFT_35684 [Parachaetomium inaequale]|uniref:Uncharacterized protein n=1 Tax=Parachaetomium inaequale TaxID=2588326 RepID=A0AAN6SRD1_9PEZI|nr:hypothetical protein C8A01DRAFT_35684 [Parachaetomium inaequale]
MLPAVRLPAYTWHCYWEHAVGLDSITTVTTLTVPVDLLVTLSDWTGFAHSTSSLGSPSTSSTDASGNGSSGSGAGPIPRPWDAVLGATIGALTLIGIICFVFWRRRKLKRTKKVKEGAEAWAGKPELHAESLPGRPGPPQELDARPRSPQELEVKAEYSELSSRDSRERSHVASENPEARMGEMAANEPPAQEMGVESLHCEMGGNGKE